jgi:excisionase family DNA binding protein
VDDQGEASREGVGHEAPDDEDVVTIPEAARRLGVSRHTLQKAAQEKRLPAQKVGGGRLPYLVRLGDVRNFLQYSRPGRRQPRFEGDGTGRPVGRPAG